MAHDILIVDDEADIRMLTTGILEDEGYQTREARNSTDALVAIETRRPNLVLLDIWLEGSALDGMEILENLSTEYPGLPVVMMSGHGNIETAVSAINLGAFDFIEKPFKGERMILIVARAIESARLKRENQELKLRVGGEDQLIGSSNSINQIRQSIERVAGANSRVLITGPAGSGKDVVARLIHNQSSRASGPFILLNCATMKADGFEISLFGIESSDDFGGPKTTGTFEQAHNGTLFLDEVADMPMETQGKIVRVLQEQTFQRVGGAMRIEVDVRVIATSSKNLYLEMSEGRFREDLFYRLSVVPIEVPPLKEYLEDIPALADFFVAKMAQASGSQKRRFSESAIATLQSYVWPGNVRELRNVIERIMIMAPGGEDEPIRSDMIPGEICNGPPVLSNARIENAEKMGLPLREAREIFEREYLTAQVTRFGGNISRTASFIGMERSALHRKLKSLGVQSEERSQAAAND